MKLCFQSRFGREPWLQPYTDITLAELPALGHKNVHVVAPGFAVDCLETLEELAIANRKLFLESGGEQFTYIPALNGTEAHAKLMVNLIQQEAGNWLAEPDDTASRLQYAKIAGAKE